MVRVLFLASPPPTSLLVRLLVVHRPAGRDMTVATIACLLVGLNHREQLVLARAQQLADLIWYMFCVVRDI